MKRISRGKNLEDDLKAVTHLVPNAFGPRTFGPPQLVPNWLVPLDKRSPTNSVPMNKWSPKIWDNLQMLISTNGLYNSSLWIFFPIDKWSSNIWSSGTIGPPGQMVGQMAPRIFCLSRGTGCGDLEYGDQIGLGPFVQGNQIFGDHLSSGTEFDGDSLSRWINF